MNWRLLDIRVGRANRGQFFISVILYFYLAFLVLDIKNFALQSTMLFPATYLFALMLMRRLRDIGIKTSTTIQWGTLISLLISLVPVSQIILVLLGFKDYELLTFSLVSLIFLIPVSCVGLALFFIFIPILFVCEGWSVENEYGQPPKGLNFATMITQTTRVQTPRSERP